ncbi:MAG: PA2169 family four-helix-bundle protein [Beijerinckiaceae bacterium]|nr:PA2169 family four-helix-bundle protein [Beijerinckiaceae bacterium]MCZ8300386.1 PA2169 family four-helix-bundle protein [Beijerinckiaceae bacterium]
MTVMIDTLSKLHVAAIDARDGYKHASEDADGAALRPLFNTMQSLHGKRVDELGGILSALGALPQESGSLMSVVNRTIVSIRSLFGGLDQSVLPGLINGEEQIIVSYNDALSSLDLTAGNRALLTQHRDDIRAQIDNMRTQTH